METTTQFEVILKLRQRLIRLIKLGESKIDDNKSTSIDRTAEIEECVRSLFNHSSSVEIFVQDVQRILNVTIKSSLVTFLVETIPLAQNQYDVSSWDTFKTMSFPNSTRLPSLQQARFRLPSSCPQLIDLTASAQSAAADEPSAFIPNIRSDANVYQQRLIQRFARQNFHLNQCAEQLIFETLSKFLRHLIERIRFYTEHRTDIRCHNSNSYEMTSHVREQIRFLIDLDNQRKADPIHSNDDEQKRMRSREYRLSLVEELRHKEANEMARHVLRDCRLKRQKTLADENQKKSTHKRILRANLQDLFIVMENLPILKRSKTFLFAYANR